jgi:origin recognition complex subunit 5
MKASERKRRKKGGGGVNKGRPSKHRKIQRKLLGPQAFILERMLAIFHAIVPHPVPGGTGDVMAQVAMLASSRLLVKTSGAADVLDAGTKWRVNVGWEYILGVARGVGFDLESFLVE